MAVRAADYDEVIHGVEEGAEVFLVDPERGLELLAVGDVQRVTRQQRLTALGDRELDRGIGAARQRLVGGQHLTLADHAPVIGDDLGGQFGREQFRRGLAY